MHANRTELLINCTSDNTEKLQQQIQIITSHLHLFAKRDVENLQWQFVD